MVGGEPVGYLQPWLRIWTRDYKEQIQLEVRAALELGASGLQVYHSNHSATLPLLTIAFTGLYYSHLLGMDVRKGVTVFSVKYSTLVLIPDIPEVAPPATKLKSLTKKKIMILEDLSYLIG